MSKESAFWDWFVAHSDKLTHFEQNQEPVFDKLSAELYKIDENLFFEFGPEQDGRRQFVISAAGIRSAFPAVEALVAAAPPLASWHVIAFRPRSPVMDCVIKIGEHEIDPEFVGYCLLTNEETKELGLYLFIPGYNENNGALQQLGYLLLDAALGEYDVETKLSLICMYPPEEEVPGPRYQFRELRAQFDQVYADLHR